MHREDNLQKAYADLVVAAQNALGEMDRSGAAQGDLIEKLRKPLADVLRAKGQGKAANNLERGVTMPSSTDPKIAAGEARLATVEAARAAGAGSDQPLMFLSPSERELIERHRAAGGA